MLEKKHRGWRSPSYTEIVVVTPDGDTRKEITSQAAKLLALIWHARHDTNFFTVMDIAAKMEIEEFRNVFPLAVSLKKAGLINIVSFDELSRVLPFEKIRLSISTDFTLNLNNCLDTERSKIEEAGVRNTEKVEDAMKISFICD